MAERMAASVVVGFAKTRLSCEQPVLLGPEDRKRLKQATARAQDETALRTVAVPASPLDVATKRGVDGDEWLDRLQRRVF